jgi:hypothetical protein
VLWCSLLLALLLAFLLALLLAFLLALLLAALFDLLDDFKTVLVPIRLRQECGDFVSDLNCQFFQ